MALLSTAADSTSSGWPSSSPATPAPRARAGEVGSASTPCTRKATNLTLAESFQDVTKRLLRAPELTNAVPLWAEQPTSLSALFEQSVSEHLRLRGVGDAGGQLIYQPQHDVLQQLQHYKALTHSSGVAQLQRAMQEAVDQRDALHAQYQRALQGVAQLQALVGAEQQARLGAEQAIAHARAEQQAQAGLAAQQAGRIAELEELQQAADEQLAAAQAEAASLRASAASSAAAHDAEAATLRAVSAQQAGALETEREKRAAATVERSEMRRRINGRDAKIKKLEKEVRLSKEQRGCASRKYRVILENAPERPACEHLCKLIDSQVAVLSNASGTCMWPTDVLMWCCEVYRQSPSAYEAAWAGGLCVLPTPGHVKKTVLKALNSTSGFDDELIATRIRLETQDFKGIERDVVLLFDETVVVADLAFKLVKGKYHYFGLADEVFDQYAVYGGGEQAKAVHEQLRELQADHALVFMIVSIGAGGKGYKRVVGVHAVRDLDYLQLDYYFWRTVELLWEEARLVVRASCQDGGSANRLGTKMWASNGTQRKGSSNNFTSASSVNYVMALVPGYEGTMIHHISDPPHVIKKVSTHFEKSGNIDARRMAMPDHLVQVVAAMFPPPQGATLPEEGTTLAAECFIRLFRRCYDLLADSRTLAYYTMDETKDPRIRELKDIVRFVRAWHEYIKRAPWQADVTEAQKAAMFLSHQLFYDIQQMIEGFLGLLGDLCARYPTVHLLPRKVNNDVLENLFGCVKFRCTSLTVKAMVDAVPREEARLQGKQAIATKERLLKRNSGGTDMPAPALTVSGDAGTSTGALHAAGAAGSCADPNWRAHHAFVLPADFDARCAAALAWVPAGPMPPGHHGPVRHRPPPLQKMHLILYHDFKKIQESDERRQQMGGFKMMPWLTTKIHVDRTGWSRMRVGYALAVISIGTADHLQTERYVARQMGAQATAAAQATAKAVELARKREAGQDDDE